MVERLGHQVVHAAHSGTELIRACEQLQPQLVITDIVMPGIDGIEAAEKLWLRFNVPVVLMSAFHNHDLLERARIDPIFGYLVKPIKEADLDAAISTGTAQFERFQKLLEEANNLRQSLADRKIIEKAKGVVMRRTGLDEAQAYRKLQKLAWDSNRKLVDIARVVLAGEEIMHEG
jgi:response regulator NasT